MTKQQLEMFPPTKPRRKWRSVWQVPPMRRSLSSIARALGELFAMQTDLRRALLRSEAHSNHLLRDLRGRHDALPLITSLWNQTFVLTEENLAEQLGLSVAELRAHIEPIFCRTECADCQEEIEVCVQRDEADATRRGGKLWWCASCASRREERPGSTCTKTRARAAADNLIELPTRTQRVQ